MNFIKSNVMGLFVALSLLGTISLAALTYEPVNVCERVGAKTTVIYNADGSGTATTGSPSYTCYPSHL